MRKNQKSGVQPPKKTTYPTSEEKLKIAKQLYKDNPSKVYADAVKRAEINLSKEKTPSKGGSASKGGSVSKKITKVVKKT